MAKKYNWRAIKIHFSYDIKQAAKALKCSEATIRSWIKEGLPIYADRKPLLTKGPIYASLYAIKPKRSNGLHLPPMRHGLTSLASNVRTIGGPIC